jgi:hypothetical protein
MWTPPKDLILGLRSRICGRRGKAGWRALDRHVDEINKIYKFVLVTLQRLELAAFNPS